MPSLIGRQGENTKFCSREHVAIFKATIEEDDMAGNSLEEDEQAPLWEAVKGAGQYLDQLGIHDLRYLNKDQLLHFGSVIIAGFAENRTEWFDNKRHPDDRLFPMEPPLDAAGNVIKCGPNGEVVGDAGADLDDEIPF